MLTPCLWIGITDVSEYSNVLIATVKQSDVVGLLDSENEGTVIVRNVGTCLPIST
jgi:hypothetical protein